VLGCLLRAKSAKTQQESAAAGSSDSGASETEERPTKSQKREEKLLLDLKTNTPNLFFSFLNSFPPLFFLTSARHPRQQELTNKQKKNV
jgi:hypothetical protein